MTPLIEVSGLRYRYDDGTPALKASTFGWTPGKRRLLGANGSGKTTFVLHLNGLLAGEGTFESCGLAVSKANCGHPAKVGLVFQDSESQLFMPTVLEDVAFGPLNQGMSPADGRRARAGGASNRWAWKLPRGRPRII